MPKKITMKKARNHVVAPQKPRGAQPLGLQNYQKKRFAKPLMTEDNLARPVHILVQDFQQEAILTLVSLMRTSKNDSTRQKSATEILALGGNSAEMLKVQAIMSGRNKDISQMSNDELDAFIVDAKRKLDMQRDIASHDAQVVSPEQSVVSTAIEGVIATPGDDPTPGDMLNPHCAEGWGM